MLLSTFGSIISYVIFGFANSLWILFASRLIAGIMGGNISTAQAYVADVTTHDERAKGMGLIGAAFGIGFVMGPAIATLLIHPSFLNFAHIPFENRFSIPGFFAAALSFISFLCVLFKLPETVKSGGLTPDNERIVRPGIFSKSFWEAVFNQTKSGASGLFAMLILSVFLLSFSQANLYSAFPLFCKDLLGLNAEKVGMFFVYLGMIAVLIQGIFMKSLSQKFGERNLFLTGSILMPAGLFLIPFAHSTAILMLFLCLMAVGSSLCGPTLNSLISKEADPSKVGATMGVSQGIASLGRAIGPTWGGFLYALHYHLPFAVTAIVLSATIWVGLKLRSRTPSL